MRRYLFILLIVAMTIWIDLFINKYHHPTINLSKKNIANSSNFPRIFENQDGSKITIAEKPKRIVSLTLATDEILLAICSKNNIAALHSISLDQTYSNCVEESKQIPIHVSTDVEQVLILQPDLIFVSSYSKAETIKLLVASGAPICKLENFNSIEIIEKNILDIGYAIGEENAAQILVNQMESKLLAITLQNEIKPRVISYSAGGYVAAGNTIFDDCVNRIGVINIASEKGLVGFPKVNYESLLEWDPDYIVIGVDQNKFQEFKQQMLDDPILSSLRAVRQNHIISINTPQLLATSHHVIKFVEALAQNIFNK